ncbi:MAG: hypothetical protein KF855_09870 [Acidobacteria bacterium]|nr:hypothetical protein [Acidobacteriota bacterium]
METASIKTWADRWKVTGKRLAEIRREEFQRADVTAIFLSLTDASEAALIAYPPKPTSGLLEMQNIFRKLAKK